MAELLFKVAATTIFALLPLAAVGALTVRFERFNRIMMIVVGAGAGLFAFSLFGAVAASIWSPAQ